MSNFILGGYVSAPLVKDVLSVVASARMSPLVVGINGYKVGVYLARGQSADYTRKCFLQSR